MRYVVVGAGAVGGALGIALMRAGSPVTFVARGAHLQALRRDGFVVATPQGTSRYAVQVFEGPEELPLQQEDVLLLAVKSQDTASAVSMWSEADVLGADGDVIGSAGETVPLVCLQNGMDNERVAQRFFDRVVGACVWVPGQLVAPGTVVLPGSPHVGAVDVGLYPHGEDAVARQLAADLRRGGIVTRVSADVVRLKTYKLLANLNHAVSALLTPGRWHDEVMSVVQSEARAAFAAAGVDLTDLEKERERVAPLTRVAGVQGFDFVGNSTVQSLAAGAGSVETDYLNGEVALLGHLHGVATPVNRALQRLSRRAARTHAAPRSFDREDLESTLRRGTGGATEEVLALRARDDQREGTTR